MSNFVIITYRVFAILIILMPLVINLTVKGGITASLIYAPILTIIALLIAVYLDGKVVAAIHHSTLRFAHHTLNHQRIRKVKPPLLARFKDSQCCFK